MNAQRRHDDPTPNPDADEAERILAELPTIVPRLHRWREATLLLAVLTLVAFLLVSYRTEIQSREIKRGAYEQCTLVNDNALAINEFIDTIISSVSSSDLYTAEEKRTRLHSYEAIKQTLPVCKKP